MFTKSKSRLSSFNFPFNCLSHQCSFFPFGSLSAPKNSETYAAAAYTVLFNSVRFRISIFLSTQMTLFTAHFTFALRIPRNDFNCSFSFLYIWCCSNISFLSSCKTAPCYSTMLQCQSSPTSHSSSLLLYRSWFKQVLSNTQWNSCSHTQHCLLHQTQNNLHNHFGQIFQSHPSRFLWSYSTLNWRTIFL